MEKTTEALKLEQAKRLEQEKMNKKLTEQMHSYRKDIIKLKEELHSSKAKVSGVQYLYCYFNCLVKCSVCDTGHAIFAFLLGVCMFIHGIGHAMLA